MADPGERVVIASGVYREFVDGHPLEPVDTANELAGPSPPSLNFFTNIHWSPLFKEFQPEAGKVWIEPNGMTLRIRLVNDDDPAKHTIEITTKEQVFSPAQRYQQYIRVKGITLERQQVFQDGPVGDRVHECTE